MRESTEADTRRESTQARKGETEAEVAGVVRRFSARRCQTAFGGRGRGAAYLRQAAGGGAKCAGIKREVDGRWRDQWRSAR